MVNINIAISEGLHKQLKLQAVIKGKTLKKQFLEVLEEEIKNG